MFKSALAWFRRRRLVGSTLVLFIPFKKLGPRDAVTRLLPYLRRGGRVIPIRVIIERRPEHFLEVINGAKLKPRRLIVFGHPYQGFTGVAVNRAKGGNREVLLLPWWQVTGLNIDLLVAHVCRGAEIFGQAQWRKTFPKWLSYSADIKAYLISARGSMHWAQLLEKIMQAALVSHGVASLRDRMAASYLEGMANIRDGFDDEAGDTLNLMYFSEAVDSLTTSEEYTRG